VAFPLRKDTVVSLSADVVSLRERYVFLLLTFGVLREAVELIPLHERLTNLRERLRIERLQIDASEIPAGLRIAVRRARDLAELWQGLWPIRCQV
jgi:hypothetical protein